MNLFNMTMYIALYTYQQDDRRLVVVGITVYIIFVEIPSLTFCVLA